MSHIRKDGKVRGAEMCKQRCETCKKWFQPVFNRSRFCSRKCGNAFYNAAKKKILDDYRDGKLVPAQKDTPDD